MWVRRWLRRLLAQGIRAQIASVIGNPGLSAFARLVNGTPVLVPLSIDAIDKSYGTWGLNLH